MQHRAGLLKVGCVCAMILMQSPDAGAAGVACRLKDLTAHTKSLLEDSLRCFDRANGDHLGTWPPGFPELRVKRNSPLSGSAVQCCLLFVAAGLRSILEDQRTDLNPEDVSLLQQLKDTGHMVQVLVACAKATLGGDCSPKTPSEMPGPAFERKQWGHTLLRAATDYLAYLERQVGLRGGREKATSKKPEPRGARHER